MSLDVYKRQLKGLRDEGEQERYMQAVERLFQMKGENGHEMCIRDRPIAA